MDFWDSFWATVWGALAGAVVGALAAWGFALDLRRRDRATAHRDAMTRWLGRVMDALTTYEEIFRNWPPGLPFLGTHEAAYDAATAARADVLSALRTALLDADEVEHPVLDAAREAIIASGANDHDPEYVSHVAVTLSGWWRGEVSAEDALQTFARMMRGSARGR